jgi:hypothetical protein
VGRPPEWLRAGIYRRRWQLLWPWYVTRPWPPRVLAGADEWCNPSVMVVTPFGAVVVFWRRGRMRDASTGPCDACRASDERDRAEGWTVFR